MIRALILAAGLSVLIPVSGATKDFFVSPDGNDQWSGTKDTPATDRQDGPKASLQSALAAARAFRHEQPNEQARIVLRGGTYALNAPLQISPDDSGTDATHPLVLTVAPNETAVVSGGRRITGWHKLQGNLWETEIPEVRDGKWYFRQLFINGERKQRARTPNQGYYRIDGASPQEKPVKIHFHDQEIKKAWAEDGDVEVVAYLAWSDLRMQIRSVDEAAHIATLSGDPRPSNQEKNAQYYIENAPDALDAPGEWYLNRRTGVLRYQAQPGENLNEAEVIAPKLLDLVQLKGEPIHGRFVQHITFKGLTFSYTDWDLSPEGYADTQAAIAIHGDFFAEGTVDCRIEGCTFSHLAGYGLEFGRGCHDNYVVGNEIVDLGAGGIRIGEPSIRQNPAERNSGQVVTDNHMHALGRVYPPAVGVLILQSGRNHIAHNEIHDLYYTAVSVGWNWGYQETPCRENVVEFNHLYDIGQYRLSDMGAVYTLGIQRGTVIRNNLIHDVNSFTYGGWGLYPDEGSTDIVWENNVVYRTKSAGFHQHYGRENIVRNNIFALGKEYQLMRTREESHLSFLFFNNIVYFNSGELLGSNWKNDRYLSDFNLFFDDRPGASGETLKFSHATLQEWRERGHDVHSLITDPLLVAPEKGDFRLQENSPALKLGFHPIDLSTVGVRPANQR